MRTLTAKQKKLLKEWFDQNYPEKTGYSKFRLADKIDTDIYIKVWELHPTEIHYQNVNHYLESLVK